jgi:putative SbcD/Mre11-related phosphoesterase
MRVHDDWLLTPYRAAIHLPTATAVVADLHLGYDQVRRRGGEAVPSTGFDEILSGLTPLVATESVRRLVIAGDLFEDGRTDTSLTELLAWLRDVDVELAGMVPGNHDRGLPNAAITLPIFPEGIRLGDWRVVHGDGPSLSGCAILGHWHPCFRWGAQIAAPCYLVGAERIILPAFSADAAGVNVLREQRWGPYRCCVIAGDEVLDFGVVVELRKALRPPV